MNTLIPDETEEPLLKENPSSDDSIIRNVDASNTTNISHGSNTNIVIDNTKHPLLGLWEGHFKVKVASGEESIEEVFFFYTMQRTGNNNTTTTSELKLPVELQHLPPDPQFPYSVILLQSSTTHCLSTNTINTSSSSSSTKEKEGNTTKEGCNDTAIHINHPITNLEAIDNSIEAINNDNQDDSNESLFLESKILPPDSILLLGFGKNCFGRFSIAGIYNEKTRSLSCEKRYMVSKYPSKRGRRSYAESSAIAIAGNINRKVTSSKPHKQHSASALMMINNNNDALMYEDTLISHKDATAVGKRKRISFSTQQSTGICITSQITGTTKIKHKGDDTKHRNSNVISNKPNKLDLLQAQIAAAHAMVITIAGNNALIGIRDPDNDDLNTFYREAFQDCDTGDIYEGGWAYGTRYGKGICVYNDGLMYEGNWVLNKEHGRGQLMTGDRQVIYSGDWLDGFMHGYGTYNFSNGDQYVGDWREGNRHGRGDYTFVNGCRYTGEWKDNKRSGKGIFIWPDKSYYNGDWEQDQRHGRGRLELANGFSYEGIWARNIIEGKGTSHFPGGQEYEGTYKLGLREGRGIELNIV